MIDGAVIARQRIAISQDLIMVGHAVVIRVDSARIGAIELLVVVGEAVPVKVLGCVGSAVAIGVNLLRVSAREVLVQVVQAVAVKVLKLFAGGKQAVEVLLLPIIGNAVVVGIPDAVVGCEALVRQGLQAIVQLAEHAAGLRITVGLAGHQEHQSAVAVLGRQTQVVKVGGDHSRSAADQHKVVNAKSTD